VLILIVSVSSVVASLAGAAVYLALRARELARERDTLADEVDRLTGEVDGWVELVRTVNVANYRMACQLHGKAAVDRAMADAHRSGTN
jgi:hypothetical protein